METVDLIALVLVLVGALNWGLVGLLNIDLVAVIFGSVPVLAKIVYDLVGLSALYVAYNKFIKK